MQPDALAGEAAAAKLAGDWQARAAKIVGTGVYPALDRQIALVKQLRAKARSSAGVWDVPEGAALYAAALEQATTTNFTPDEVHKMVLSRNLDAEGRSFWSWPVEGEQA